LKDRKAYALLLIDLLAGDGSILKTQRYHLFLGDRRQRVCYQFFQDVYCVPSTFALSCRKVESAPRNRLRPLAEFILEWFDEVQKFHEFMPDLTGAGRIRADALRVAANADGPPEVIAAPMVQTGVQLSYPSRYDVFLHFVKDLQVEAPGQTPPSYTHFRTVWKSSFSHVRLRKHLRFAKCDTCIYWRTKIGAFDRRDEKAREKHRVEYRKHLSDIRTEREAYHRKRRESARCGSESLSIIFGGADQGAYGELLFARCCTTGSELTLVFSSISRAVSQAFHTSMRKAKLRAKPSSKSITCWVSSCTVSGRGSTP
jgi:hypothetical protein